MRPIATDVQFRDLCMCPYVTPLKILDPPMRFIRAECGQCRPLIVVVVVVVVVVVITIVVVPLSHRLL